MITSLEYPTGPVAIESPFYVPRPPVEEQAYQDITKPGSLIRIKAPKEMGKSSLMLRINHHARSLGYYTATVDLQKIDTADFQNIDRFLRVFCTQISYALNLKPNLDDYWDEDLGSKVNCTLYFQWYLLDAIHRPLVLCINELSLIFEYPQLAQEFLPLLRSWFEEAKQVQAWSKLRLVVVYSTEVYVPMKINQSPFNIGLPLTLPEFTRGQVQQLARLHDLPWDERKSEKLMAMVGGHPLLIRLTLYHLCQNSEFSLEQLLATAARDTGIYREHLRRHLATLQADDRLATVFQQIITRNYSGNYSANYSENVNPILIYKLESLGLLKFVQGELRVRCDLYRIYLGRFLNNSNLVDISTQNQILRDRLLELEKAKQELEKLSHIDPLTQVANRRYFQEYLDHQWQKLAATGKPLSIIFCDLDNFKLYNDLSGHQLGDDCLKQVAHILGESIAIKDNLVARYGGDEFVIILPDTDAKTALKIAHIVRNNIENLKIMIWQTPPEEKSHITQITVSLGVATTIPNPSNFADILIAAADQALYDCKKAGRNGVSLSKILNFGAEMNGDIENE